MPPQRERPPLTVAAHPNVSLLARWAGGLQNLRRTRLCLALLVPLLWITMGNHSPCFTAVFATSELCLQLWVLVIALTNRGTPHQPQLPGTLGLVKAALGLMYPQATKVVDALHQSGSIVLCVVQDLCVSVFALVTLVAVVYSLSSYFSTSLAGPHPRV